jgi:hypothetical protein
MARNPIGVHTPVYVHEEVTEELVVYGGSTTRVLKWARGARITVAEALAHGVPLRDAEGFELDEEGERVADKPAKQRAKPEMETQEVKAPLRKKAK